MTDQICQKWFAKFYAGDFSQDVAPWLGRTVEVNSGQIDTFIEINQHCTLWEIANILKICKSIQLVVKIKKKCVFYGKNTQTF